MSARSRLVALYAGLQVIGYVLLALPGRPGYGDLDPAVWVVMDFFVFVTLALAADLPAARWVARLAAVVLTAALAAGAADDPTGAYVGLVTLATLMVPVSIAVRRRPRDAAAVTDVSAAPAR